MNPMTTYRMLALTALSLFAGAASAHTGHHAVTGFVSGLAHPVLGLDHLLAMTAIGLWAAQQGGRALWAVPAAFVGAMALGAGLAAAGLLLPYVETGIAASVLVLGLLIAMQQQWGIAIGMSIAAGFALFHGYAHGLEMPQTASFAAYAGGFVLTTLALHGAGLSIGLIGRRAVQIAGAGLAAGGLALVLAF